MTTIGEQIAALETTVRAVDAAVLAAHLGEPAVPDAPESVSLAASPEVAPGAMESPGMPVPDDPAAVSLFTAHRVHEILHKLGHGAQRMTAARDAKGDLRNYHAARLAGHLEAALDAGHDLASHLRAHYPAEGKELDAVADSVGLAKAVSGDAKAATTAHLLETTLHELTHGSRHAQQMADGKPGTAEWTFNREHAEKHLGGAVEHAGKLAEHFRDNYPEVAHWLNGLHGAGDGGEGKPGQHARYAGAKGADMASEGTIGAQIAADV